MIKIIPNLIPKDNTKFGIAFSGGVDSVVFSHFLKRGKKNFDLYFFNHGDDNDKIALELAREWSKELGVQLYTNENVSSLKASEGVWREARYEWLESFKDTTIITGHNFEDIVTGYVMFWIKGQERFIPVKRNNILRPFLLTHKSDILNYAKKHNLNWNEESYNHDTKYARVRVSKNILPEMYKINPGFDCILESKFKDKLHRDGYI